MIHRALLGVASLQPVYAIEDDHLQQLFVRVVPALVHAVRLVAPFPVYPVNLEKVLWALLQNTGHTGGSRATGRQGDRATGWRWVGGREGGGGNRGRGEAGSNYVSMQLT